MGFLGLEISAVYQLDNAAEFVEQWMSFSISNLGGAEPTVEYLRNMEIKEYQNKAANDFAKTESKSEAASGSLQVYNDSDDDMTNDLLGSYVCVTPKVSR